MKKTLAIVLALVMVLCMIPAMSAGSETKIESNSYTLQVFSVNTKKDGSVALVNLNKKTKTTSIEASYDYETENVDVTDKWAEDRKMGIVKVSGWDEAFESVPAGGTFSATVDNDKITVGTAAYKDLVGYQDDAGKPYVQFPVQLTKAGYSDTFLVTLTYTAKNGDTLTQTAKISVKLVNTSAYKAEKTASVVDIQSKTDDVTTYIVGGRIYLDYVEKVPTDAVVEVTFVDENKAPFTAITYANNPKKADNKKADAANITANNGGEYKLVNSAAKYTISGEAQKVVFELETVNAFYYTDKYDIVIRTGIKEEDPKGIYFAEPTKTIAMGESFAPVVLGVKTGKKVNATIGIEVDKTDAQVIDVKDGKNVIGTREGVAYITASYKAAGQTNTYTAASMKVIVTLPGESIPPVEPAATTYYVTCRNLNVRKGAGTSYAKAGMIHRGDAVEVVEIKGGWAKLANGTYVCAKYIAK